MFFAFSNNNHRPHRERQKMKMDYSDMLRDADMMKKGIRRTVKEMKKNDLEFSVRFSWADVLMVVAGICAVLIVFGWIKKIEKKICVRREAKRLIKAAEEKQTKEKAL